MARMKKFEAGRRCKVMPGILSEVGDPIEISDEMQSENPDLIKDLVGKGVLVKPGTAKKKAAAAIDEADEADEAPDDGDDGGGLI